MEKTDEVIREGTDFEAAVAAITSAVRAGNDDQGSDGADFIARVLATVAANLGSSSALTAARSGSWEADLVEQLVRGTVGWDDEYLMTFRTAPVEIVVNTEDEFDSLGLTSAYEASIDYIGRAMFGDRWDRSRGQLTGEELDQVESAEDRIYELVEREQAEYQLRFTATVEAEVKRRRSAGYSGANLEDVPVTVRYLDHSGNQDELTEAWGGGVAGELYQHARDTTALPGTQAAPEWTIGRDPVTAMLAAGHWPHLRIPELAHHGTPASTTKET